MMMMMMIYIFIGNRKHMVKSLKINIRSATCIF